jgi:branched-chain amino acid transport system substrate-binding protein
MCSRYSSVPGVFLVVALMLMGFMDIRMAGAAPAGKPIRIGDVNSYSGLATVYTFPYKEGIAMALNEINAAGGVLNRPLEFVFRDDKLKPDEAVKMARELVFQERVDFLSGCISSAVGLALSEFAKESKALFFASHCQTSALTWDKGHKYVAHTTNNTTMYTRALATVAATYPYTKWAHIAPDYEYGHDLWNNFWGYLKTLKPNVELLQENWPKLGEPDHSAYITALLQSGAEAFFSGVWGAQEIAFVKQGKPYGLFEKLTYFSPAIGNPDELDPLGKEAPVGAISTGFPWYDEELQKRHPTLSEWVKKYQDRTGGQEPKLGSSWGYATAYIIAEAIKHAGAVDINKVIEALDRGFEMEFPWGTVVMRGCDHQALPPQWTGIVRLNAQGKPIMAAVQETQGKDIVLSCEEVANLRKK